MNKIAVLLTCHNRKGKTLLCLSSLYNCLLLENQQLDVFLVDDGSTDGTSVAIKEKFPQVTIIQGSGHLFWNRGMFLAWNTAAKTKDYDYYLWLNDDTSLYSQALQELLVCSELENNQKIICGTTCAVNDPSQITYGGRIINKKEIVMPNGQNQSCDYFNGNVVLVPRSVYRKVGMNDPAFHHALGDFDYGLRARKVEITSIVAPSIIGECNTHTIFAAWCNPKTSILKRIKLLYNPLGNHPIESFIFEKRHKGLYKAFFHFFTNHLRAIIPVLWMK
ncbi:acetylglucosaminyltransferase [Bacteroidia bacterium]|nr:acetylglucosaminyltransferase [Bacteroidia bacterium]